jgi:hypothetical protein
MQLFRVYGDGSLTLSTVLSTNWHVKEVVLRNYILEGVNNAVGCLMSRGNHVRIIPL